MTTPQKQIMDVVEARLANITTANGYYTDVGKIKRAGLTAFKPGDLPAINLWAGPDNIVDQVSKGHGWQERQLDLFVEYHDKTRDRPFSNVVYELGMDIVISVMRSVASPTVADNPDISLGGIVTTIKPITMLPELGEGQAPWCGCLVTFAVFYKVEIGNPLILIT